MSEWDDRDYWAWMVRMHGRDVLEMMAVKVERDMDLQATTNPIERIGQSISLEIRRRILLGALRASECNLTQTAKRLHMSGLAALRRAIRELGLGEEYRRAKADLQLSKQIARRNVRPLVTT